MCRGAGSVFAACMTTPRGVWAWLLLLPLLLSLPHAVCSNDAEGTADVPGQTALVDPMEYKEGSIYPLPVDLRRSAMREVMLSYYAKIVPGARRRAPLRLQCKGLHCPQLGKCGARYPQVSACWNRELDDSTLVWLKAPLNCPKLTRRGTPGRRGFNPACSHPQDFKDFGQTAAQVMLLRNVYVSHFGIPFNASVYYNRRGCARVLERDYLKESGLQVRRIKRAFNLVYMNGCNFYHGLIENIPQYLVLASLLAKFPDAPLLNTYDQWRIYQRLFQPIVGVPLENILKATMDPTTLFFVEKLYQPVYQCCGSPSPALWRAVRRQVLLPPGGIPMFDPGPGWQRRAVQEESEEASALVRPDWVVVYIKRPMLDRSLVQGARIEALLRRMFGPDRVAIFLGNVPILEAQGLFRRAVLLVAAHGAAMANLVFMPPGASVLEIRPRLYPNPVYHALSQVCHLNYYLLLGSGNKTSMLSVSMNRVITELTTIYASIPFPTLLPSAPLTLPLRRARMRQVRLNYHATLRADEMSFAAKLRCKGPPCPSLSGCGGRFPDVSACWNERLNDPRAVWLSAPASCPKLARFGLPGPRGMNPRCSHKEDYAMIGPFAAQVVLLRNVFVDSAGTPFNTSVYFNRAGCNKGLEIDYLPGTGVRVQRVKRAFNLGSKWKGRSLYTTLVETAPLFFVLAPLLATLPGIPLMCTTDQWAGYQEMLAPLVGVSGEDILRVPLIDPNHLYFVEELYQPVFQHCGAPSPALWHEFRRQVLLPEGGVPMFEPGPGWRRRGQTREEQGGEGQVEAHSGVPPDWVVVYAKWSGQLGSVEQSEQIEQLLRDVFSPDRVVVSERPLPTLHARALFSRAVLLVGLHGAALANLIFMRPNFALLEIRPKHLRNPCYHALAEVCRVKYHLTLGRKKGALTFGSSKTASISVDLKEILREVSNVKDTIFQS